MDERLFNVLRTGVGYLIQTHTQFARTFRVRRGGDKRRRGSHFWLVIVLPIPVSKWGCLVVSFNGETTEQVSWLLSSAAFIYYWGRLVRRQNKFRPIDKVRLGCEPKYIHTHTQARGGWNYYTEERRPRRNGGRRKAASTIAA